MTGLERYGAVFDEKTDWLKFLREAARGRPPAYGLRRDLDTHAAVGDLYEALEGTQMQGAMGLAALMLLEQGTPEERELMHSLSYEQAPGAKRRLLKLIEQGRERLSERDVGTILHRLLEANPGDPEVAAVLQRELERPDYRLGDLYLAARHLPDWLIQNLLSLRPPPPVDGADLTAWLIRVPESKQLALLGSIAALGKPYVDALVARQIEPWWPADLRKEREALLEAHPVFRQALAEALGRPPS